MGNPVVHFEIIGTDGAALEKFYSELFGWHVMSSPIPGGGTYGLVDTHSGKGINGGIGQTPNGENRVTIYVESSDLQAVLAERALCVSARRGHRQEAFEFRQDEVKNLPRLHL